MTISALPSIICAKVSKGDVFSVSPSPLSKDITLMFPVDFLIMVLLTTELDTYSMISTIICDMDFPSSVVSGLLFITHKYEQSFVHGHYTPLELGYMIHTSPVGESFNFCPPIFSSTGRGRIGLVLQWDNSYTEDRKARIAAVLFCSGPNSGYD